MARVEIRHLGKDVEAPGRAAPLRILGDVSLDVTDGEFLVLVGPSGCGKTTLLRAIAGLERPSRGDLLFDGVRVNDLAPGARDVAMVFQSYALYPHLTVRQNLAFGLQMRKTPAPEIERLVADAAAMLEIAPYLDRKPAQLSGGQRQRVAMGRAVVRRPKVFLFDEPLSNLDAALRGQMRVELKRLHQRLGATMIYVTHDQVEAMTLADRIAVLRRGDLEQVGSPRQLYERPENLFVARFIGTPEMNALPGEVRGGRFHAGSITVEAPGLPDGATTLGLRPEQVELGGDGGVAQGTVEVVENLGWDALLHLRLDEGPLCVRLESARAPRVGERVALCFPAAALHFFDGEGRRREPAGR